MLPIQRLSDVFGGAVQCHVVLNQHAVVKHSDGSGASDTPITTELRRHEDNVIGLPLAWCSRCVNQWNVLLVNAGCLAVGVGFIAEGIEYLHFVSLHQEYATVATILPFASNHSWCLPFNVKLNITETLSRTQVTRTRDNHQMTVCDFPLWWAGVDRLPLSQIFAIEQHNGIRWWCLIDARRD